MNEEYIELAANYGIDVRTPYRFYETQKLLLVEIMKHLQRVDKMTYRGDNYKSVKIPDVINIPLFNLANNTDFKNTLHGIELVGDKSLRPGEFKFVAHSDNKLKFIVVDDIDMPCRKHFDGKYTMCLTHNECWMTDKDDIPESCQCERIEQDDLQDVADKIEAGHEILNTHNFGNCVNCKGCDDNDFFESVVKEQDELADYLLPNNLVLETKDDIAMKIANQQLDNILNKPVVFSDEQLEAAERVLNSQLFTCSECKLHGKPDCPLDVPQHSIPSWTHETCKEFEHHEQ